MKMLLLSPLMRVHVYKVTCESHVCKRTYISDQTPTVVTNLLEHRNFGYFSFVGVLVLYFINTNKGI